MVETYFETQARAPRFSSQREQWAEPQIIAIVELDSQKRRWGLSWFVRRSDNDCGNWSITNPGKGNRRASSRQL